MRRIPNIPALVLIALAAGPAAAAIPGQLELGAVDTTDLPALDFPLPDRASLAAEDKAAAEAGEPYRFALPQDVALTPANAGRWRRGDGGREVWRLRLASPGALSLNLGFAVCDLPPGATLVVRPTRGGEALVYRGGESAPGGELWTPVLLTDDLIVELDMAPGTRAALRLELTSFNRGYRFFGEPADAKAGACNIDVICPEGDGWRPEIKSVAVYTRSGSTICSGAMVNNTAADGRPLFLTANHCGIGASNDQTLVVYWNFESPVCGAQGGGSRTDVQSGSTFLASSAVSDFCLVELQDLPLSAWEVTYAGWSRTDAVPAAAVTIHHPSGDEKSISFENDPLTVTSYTGSLSPGDGTHLRVADWDVGTTEAGSSGAPLFDANRHIVGQLHGGYAACGNNASDWYGRLAVSWEGEGTSVSRLRDWLDPAGSGAVTLDRLSVLGATPATGAAFSGPFGGPFAPAFVTYTLRNNGLTTIAWGAAADASWVAVSPAAGTLAAGAQATVSVAPTPAAEALPEGTHTATVTFAIPGVDSGGASRPVVLTVLGGEPKLVSVGPNPFRTYTTITYSLGVPVPVHRRVYDIAGRLVADLGAVDPGVGEALVWDWYGRDEQGRLLGSGVYFMELDAAGRKLQVPVTFLH